MICYTLNTRVNTPDTDPFLRTMYHGIAVREGCSVPADVVSLVSREINDKMPDTIWLTSLGMDGRPFERFFTRNEDRIPRLVIERTGSCIPHITQPSINYVVSEEVRDQLRHLSSVEFLPTRFGRLVDYEFAANDFRHLHDARYDRYLRQLIATTSKIADKLLDLPDVPRLHPAALALFELVPIRFTHLELCYPEAQRVATPTARGMISEAMISEVGFVHAPTGSFLSEDVFNRLRPWLDPSFFAWEKLEVGLTGKPDCVPQVRVLARSL